jgi:hypothetical protein
VFLALAGGAEPLDLPSAPVNDEVVLDAVALRLAAVELPLLLGILGTLDGALHSVDDELESLACAQHRLEVAGLAGWELLLVAECRIEERGQTVNPLVGLRLAHPEEQTLHRLDGVEPEIDQDEHESVCGPPEPPLAASTPETETKAPSVPTVQICLPGLLEGRKNLLETLRAQAGERLEHAAVAGKLGVADHWGFLCWSCLPRVAQVVLLLLGSIWMCSRLAGSVEQATR